MLAAGEGRAWETGMMTGGCLCGAVRYEVAADPVYAGHCHCRSCQRASGAGHSTYVGVPRAALTVRGETRSFALTGGSGRQALRHFCPVCGSQLFGTGELDPGTATLYAGSLDDPSVIRPTPRSMCTAASPGTGSPAACRNSTACRPGPAGRSGAGSAEPGRLDRFLSRQSNE